MKKENRFNIGDKVFAKVKGYPAWPAIVLEENGKKYKVKFYGTGEMGQIKFEDMSYYSKSKQKFLKPPKRRDFKYSIKEIEEAIKACGTDGSPDYDPNSTENSIMNDSMPKKRKRSISVSKNVDDIPSVNTKMQKMIIVDSDSRNRSPTSVSNSEEKIANSKKDDENEICEEHEGTSETTTVDKSLEGESRSTPKDSTDTIVQYSSKLNSKDYMVQTELEAFIAFGEHVEKHKEIYSNLPVEERYDSEFLNFPFFIEGKYIGIKLHTEWPLKSFANEYERAIYDKNISQHALEIRKSILHDNMKTLTSNFIENLEICQDDVDTIFNKKLIAMKDRILEKLKIEGSLLQIDLKIKTFLNLESAEPEKAIELLEEMLTLNLSATMLKKHAQVVDMVRRLRKYVGNMESWTLSDKEKKTFRQHAGVVRNAALKVYGKFMQIIGKSPGVNTFWDGFINIATKFQEETKDLSEREFYVLTCEPYSRENFLNNYLIKDMSLGVPFQNNVTKDSELDNKSQRSEDSG